QGGDAGLELQGHLVGVVGQGHIAALLEQLLKLDAQQPALGQHAAPLLDVVAEIGLEGRVQDHQGLAEQGAVLGAADVEGVAQPAQVGQGGTAGGQAAGQPGAVQVQPQAQLIADGPQGLHLGQAVDGADLGGLADVDQLGLDHVLVGMGCHRGADGVGGQFAVHGGAGNALVAGGLDGAGLVDADVAAGGGDGRLIGTQEGRNGGGVGLGAAHQQVDVGVGTADGLADQVMGAGRVGV